MDTTLHPASHAWVEPGLVIAPLAARDAFDAITQLGARMRAAGCVKDSFVPAVIARERAYATGLPTEGIQVAIPHTDVEHVLRDAIAVGVLAAPVEFGAMGSPGSTVNVQLVCLLAASRAEGVVLLLQKLAEMFQQQAVLRQIVSADNAATVAAIMNAYLQADKQTTS
jgi:PTS system galactitol-specific IIA component